MSGQEKGGILGIVNEMEARQHSWHERRARELKHAGSGCGSELPVCQLRTPSESGDGFSPEKKDEMVCLRIVSNVRKVAAAMGLRTYSEEAEWYKGLQE